MSSDLCFWAEKIQCDITIICMSSEKLIKKWLNKKKVIKNAQTVQITQTENKNKNKELKILKIQRNSFFMQNTLMQMMIMKMMNEINNSLNKEAQYFINSEFLNLYMNSQFLHLQFSYMLFSTLYSYNFISLWQFSSSIINVSSSIINVSSFIINVSSSIVNISNSTVNHSQTSTSLMSLFTSASNSILHCEEQVKTELNEFFDWVIIQRFQKTKTLQQIKESFIQKIFELNLIYNLFKKQLHKLEIKMNIYKMILYKLKSREWHTQLQKFKNLQKMKSISEQLKISQSVFTQSEFIQLKISQSECYQSKFNTLLQCMKAFINSLIDKFFTRVHEANKKTQSLKFYYRKQKQMRKEDINENDKLLKFI